MDKQQLIKNKLDLEYHGEAQKVNAFLILLTTGILGFVSSFIWLKENKLVGITITLTVLFMGILFYVKSVKRMKKILEEIVLLQ